MLNIFSCASWPLVCLLWRNVYLGLLPIFWLGCLFWYWAVCKFGDESFVGRIVCKYFLPFCELSFHFVYGFLCCAKTFEFNSVPFVYFCFYFHYSRRRIKKRYGCDLCQSVLPMFSSKNFILIVSSLTFRSLITLELWSGIFKQRFLRWLYLLANRAPSLFCASRNPMNFLHYKIPPIHWL